VIPSIRSCRDGAIISFSGKCQHLKNTKGVANDRTGSKSNPHHLRRTRQHCQAHRSDKHGNQGARWENDNGGNLGMGKAARRIRRITSNQAIPAENQLYQYTTRLKCAGAKRKERVPLLWVSYTDNQCEQKQLHARRSAGGGRN